MDDGKDSAEENKHNILWKRSEDEDIQSDIWDDSALIEAYDKAVSHVKEQIAKRNKMGSESDGKSSRNSSHKGKKRGRSKLKRTWKVGDACQAVYSEDGRYYEAVITYIKDGMCTVKFVGYDNEETVHVNEIKHSHGKQARIQQSLAAQTFKNNVEQIEAEVQWNGYADDTSSSVGVAPKQCLYPAHHGSDKKHTLSHAPWRNIGKPPPPHLFPGQQHHHSHMPSCLPPASSTLPCHHRTNTSQRLPPIPPPPLPIEDGIVDDDEALASMLMSWYMSGYHTGYYQGLRQVQTHHCNTKLNKSCPCSH